MMMPRNAQPIDLLDGQVIFARQIDLVGQFQQMRHSWTQGESEE
jgi:hypothetical protein